MFVCVACCWWAQSITIVVATNHYEAANVVGWVAGVQHYKGADFNDAARRFVEVQREVPFMVGSRLRDFAQN